MTMRDAVIAGGGVTGLTTALALVSLGMPNVVLLESRPQKSAWTAGQFARVSAISPASKQIFQRLSVWDALVAHEYSPIQRMHVWSGTGRGLTRFEAAETGQPALGYIVSNSLMEAVLTEALAAQAGIHYGVSAPLLSFQPDHALLQTEKTAWQARLVVAADGARSELRKQAGMVLQTTPCEQMAIVTTVQTEKPHEQTAWQCFLPEGPLAFLPLPDPHCCSIVWSVSPARAAFLQSLDDNGFCAELGRCFQHRLGEIAAVQARQAFPLMLQQAKTCVRDHFALVGDAAHVVHPLAGQGMNLGLLDAFCLADTVCAALRRGRSFGARDTLRRYERMRRPHNALMGSALTGLLRTASHPHLCVQALWQAGMNGANRSRLLKKWLAGQAFGLQQLPAQKTDS